MKKIIALVLVLVMALSVAACAKEEPSPLQRNLSRKPPLPPKKSPRKFLLRRLLPLPHPSM